MAVFVLLLFNYLDTNGRSPIKRARFMAIASLRWFLEHTPVRFGDIMRA